MGFLNFRKKSKANKALNPPSLPSPLVLNATANTATATTDAESDYHSPIADSFMMVGSSIVDMAQSSLSEDIFKELVPLSIKSESSAKSKDTIRHSLSLKSNNNSVKSSISPLRINTEIPVLNYSAIQSPLNESIISSTTRSSKQSDSSVSSLTSLSSTEEFVPLHPISRSDPRHYAIRKLGEHAPLIDLVNRSPPHEHGVTPTVPLAITAATVPGLAMERMKERHRQEYRRSMQWSPPTQPLPNAPPSVAAAAMMEYHPLFSKRANSLASQRALSMQQHLAPLSPPLVHAQVQVPLIDQIKPVAVPMRSVSSSTYTSKPFDRKPLIASIPPLVSYQQPKPVVVPVPDHRHYRMSHHVVQYQAETRHPRQQIFMGASIPEHPLCQQRPLPQNVEPSKSTKLKADYRRIVCTRKQNYVPDLVDLLDHQEEQQQHQVDEKSSFSHCSHHQPHHTLIKRHYKNADGCQQPKHHCSTTHRCNHHHRHYTTHCHPNRKPSTCCDYNTAFC
ncbi:unnamed protein product [Mucor fragilis]